MNVTGALAIFLALASTGSAQPSPDWPRLREGWRRRIASIRESGQLPLFDIGSSYSGIALGLEALQRKMDLLGLAVAVLSPEPQAQWLDSERPADWRAETGRLSAGAPERVLPARAADLGRLDDVLAGAEAGRYPVLGEFAFFAHPSNETWVLPVAGGREDVDIPLDGPLGDQLFAFSQRTGTPFLLQYEAEDRRLPVLEKMLDKYPGAKVIWRHLGRLRYPRKARLFGPDYARRLLAGHPNLYFELSGTDLQDVYVPTGEPDSFLWDRRARRLDDGWTRLIAERPWRFLSGLGLDSIDWAVLEREVAARRALIAQLPPPARDIVAYRAAWKLLFGEDLGAALPPPPAGAAAGFDWTALKRGWRARLEEIERRGLTPLIDMGVTYNELTFDGAALAREMDEDGVAMLALSPELIGDDWTSTPDWTASLRSLASSDRSASSRSRTPTSRRRRRRAAILTGSSTRSWPTFPGAAIR